MPKLRLSGIVKESIVDGPGMRYVIFTQGCKKNCEGCHNPETHDLFGGYETTTEKVLSDIKKDPLLKGVTFSGGEPFLQAEALFCLAKEIHKLGLDLVTYSGYTIEELSDGFEDNPYWEKLLNETDVLVDGPFVLKERDLTLLFRGSRNQRVWKKEKIDEYTKNRFRVL